MNRPDPLTPEERELARLLGRPAPSAPSAALDEAVLAAARAAVQPTAVRADDVPSGAAVPPARRRPRSRLPAALGLAASLVFAVGIAWQLKPDSSPPTAPAAADVAVDTATAPPAADSSAPPRPGPGRAGNGCSAAPGASRDASTRTCAGRGTCTRTCAGLGQDPAAAGAGRPDGGLACAARSHSRPVRAQPSLRSGGRRHVGRAGQGHRHRRARGRRARTRRHRACCVGGTAARSCTCCGTCTCGGSSIARDQRTGRNGSHKIGACQRHALDACAGDRRRRRRRPAPQAVADAHPRAP